MDSWNRKLRMGMVGGGPGSFIGPVHRMVVAMEQQAEMVAGVFSRDRTSTRKRGRSSTWTRTAFTTRTRKWLPPSGATGR